MELRGTNLYMSNLVYDIINEEIQKENGMIAYYKQSRLSNIVKDSEGNDVQKGSIEINYFLTERSLIELKIALEEFEIVKYDRRKIISIDKKYKFVRDFTVDVELNKVIINFESQKIELNRPDYYEQGDPVEFEKLVKLL